MADFALHPQLHVHVIGRRPGDPCWPGVVWGNLPPGPEWAAGQLGEITAAVAALSPAPDASQGQAKTR